MTNIIITNLTVILSFFLTTNTEIKLRTFPKCSHEGCAATHECVITDSVTVLSNCNAVIVYEGKQQHCVQLFSVATTNYTLVTTNKQFNQAWWNHEQFLYNNVTNMRRY